MVVLACVLAVAAAGGATVAKDRASRPLAERTSIQQAPPGPSARPRPLLRGRNIDYAYAAAGSLYVVQQADRNGYLTRLLRIDVRSGRTLVMAKPAPDAVDQALRLGGELWVTSTAIPGRHPITWLSRLNPDTLAVISRVALPGEHQHYAVGVGSMARVGSSIWIGDADRLDRFDASSAQLMAQVPFTGAGGAQVKTDPAGTVLLTSVGEQSSRVQRRNPLTGALITQTKPIMSVNKPDIGGIDGPSTWFSASGGMSGSYSRLNTTTLRSEPVGVRYQEYTNGVQAQIYDGTLWVTQPAGGPQRNFCANPITGRPRARLHIGQGGTILAADRHYIYDAFDESAPAQLVQAPIAARCRQ